MSLAGEMMKLIFFRSTHIDTIAVPHSGGQLIYKHDKRGNDSDVTPIMHTQISNRDTFKIALYCMAVI